MSSLFGIGGGGNVGASGSFYDYSIDQSLRFNDDDSLSLKRTPSTAGNRQTWSISMWIKLGNISSVERHLFEAGTSGGSSTRLRLVLTSSDTLRVTNGNANLVTSTMVLRDTSSWYHILWQNTGGTNKVFVNGEQATSVAISGDTAVNSTVAQAIGTRAGTGTTNEFDGYIAQAAIFDGTAYTYDQLTETENGILVPKDLSSLSFGTNGVLLEFGDSSAIGDDTSGNTNDFTASGFAASDVVPDSPTNNFATMNPLDQEQQGGSVNIYRQGNLYVLSQGNTGYGKTRATFAIPTSGKWYWEMKCEFATGQSVGILNASEDLDNTSHFDGFAEGYSYRNDGQKKNNGTSSSYGDSWTNNDIISVLVDADAGEIFFYKNGTIQNSGTAAFTGLDMSNNYMPIWADRTTSANSIAIFNFGQDSTFDGSETAGGNSDANGYGDFQYTVPTGALALCSANLPEPTIGPNSDTTSDEHFNTVLYTGNGSTQSITGVGFQPDWTWIKERSSTSGHTLHDSVRGAGKYLGSHSTSAEGTSTTQITSFDADGFTTGASGQTNQSSQTYASWNWKAGGTAVSNTDGSITSSVSANTDAGFSIVSYTGTGANATVGHGLASAPEMLIIKTRDSADNWPVYHAYNTSQPETDRLLLSTTDATVDSATMFNDTLPTSSVFSVGTNVSTNKSGDNFICYAFHSVEGHLKCGSYVGNGSADGTFVYTGFRPAWVMVKITSATGHWNLIDATRSPFNVAQNRIKPSDSAAEDTVRSVDFLSNGFKWRELGSAVNDGNYIYLAFAEAPFKYANAR